jgi:hypothetical protein
MHVARCQAWLWLLAFVASSPASADKLAPDFLLVLLRFGIECQRPTTPRKVCLGDDLRFAVRVEKSFPSLPILEGEKPSQSLVTYRAFYRDMTESKNSVTLRCRMGVTCITAYRSGALEKISSVRLDTCSPRTATLVIGAAREFIRSGHP